MINESFIKIQSSFGVEIENLYLRHEVKSDTIVVIYPGGGYSCDMPLLYYAREMAVEKKCDVLSMEYGYVKVNKALKREYLQEVLNESLQAVKEVLKEEYKNIIFISKSFGTIIAGEISKEIGYNRVNNFFLTPIKSTKEYMRNSRCHVILGNRDKMFEIIDVDEINTFQEVEVMVIEGANHSLEVEGESLRSIDVLKNVIVLIGSFIEKSLK